MQAHILYARGIKFRLTGQESLFTMTRLSILFLVVCAECLLEKTTGFNYYIQTVPGSSSLLSYPLISPLWQPDCDKKKDAGGGESSEGSSEGESGEKSSGESSSKEGESKEGGSSESSGEEKKEGEGESKEGESKSEESGSSEEGGSEKKEGSSEESGEKKKEEKKKTKYVFPQRTYDFPPSTMQKIMFSPLSSYSYVPYKSSYVIQQPLASYSGKSNYQYVSVPVSSPIVNGYSASPVVGRLMNNPIKIVYSSGLNYQQFPQTVVSSGARIYSVPGTTWNSAYSYYKK